MLLNGLLGTSGYIFSLAVEIRIFGEQKASRSKISPSHFRGAKEYVLNEALSKIFDQKYDVT